MFVVVDMVKRDVHKMAQDFEKNVTPKFSAGIKQNSKKESSKKIVREPTDKIVRDSQQNVGQDLADNAKESPSKLLQAIVPDGDDKKVDIGKGLLDGIDKKLSDTNDKV